MYYLNKIKSNENLVRILLLFALLFFFVGDAAKFFSKSFGFGFQEYPRVTKIVIILLLAIYILSHKIYKKAYAKSLIFILILFVLTYVLNNFLLQNTNFSVNVKANLDYLIKVSMLPYMLIPFLLIDKTTTRLGINLVLILFWINAVAILIGVIFKIETLETYYHDVRFGYKGLYNRSTYVSYLFVFVILYYYYNWRKRLNGALLIYLLFCCFISVFVGTKRIYLFLILLGVFHFIDAKLYKKKLFWVFIVISTILSVVNIVAIGLFLKSTFDKLFLVYENHGVLSAITSYRSNLLIRYYNEHIVNNWSFLNYIFGGPYFQTTRPEMDFIDLYLILGFTGVFSYIYIARKFLFNFSTKNNALLFLFVMLILFTFTSSGTIFSGNFALLLIVFKSYYYFENQNTK